MSSLSLKNIYKVYEGDVRAVNNFNLEIKDKEFIVFVGPSGCGKSTTLRMVAGLEEITSGDLFINDQRMNDVEPKDRNIAMVFQNYALYPHMSVFDNMAFGLRIRKVNQKEIEDRVNKAAEILGITNLLNRKPKALSGGQKQRVALGRAIVREPNVFLLDEPLSNLDAKLRVQMRTEITKLHKKLGTTFIYVTHDQTEAMTMGDRIVVMKDGYIQQVDTPATLYDEPCNVFVASFLGSPQMNLFECDINLEKDELFVSFGKNKESFKERSIELSNSIYLNKKCIFGIRPENITISNKGINATIDSIEHLGSETIVYCNVDGVGSNVIVKTPTNHTLNIGDNICLSFNMDKAHLFDKESEKAILGVPHSIGVNATIDNKSLVINKNKVEIPEETYNKLLDYSKEEISNILIPTDKLSLNKIKDSLELKGTVDFIKEGTDTNNIFVKCDLINSYIAFRSKENLKVNDKIALYISFNDIVFEDKLHNRLNTKYDVIENKVKANVTNVKGKTIVKFGQNKLVYDDLKIENGDYYLTLKSNGFDFEYKKKYASKNKIAYTKLNNTIKVSAYDEDVLGSKNALFLKANGFDNYITAVIDNKFSVYSMTDFKLSVKKEALVFNKI